MVTTSNSHNTERTKPIPDTPELWDPFWRRGTSDELVIQKCSDCGHLQFPPKGNCSACLSTAVVWAPVSGEGVVYSFIIYHRTWVKGFEDSIPYNVSIIELAEGTRLVSDVTGVSSDDIEVGYACAGLFRTGK